MECNKEEALRAKVIAEKKMLCRDFVGARKMVLKAQQLFPELENVTQMLTVCEVHCSAEAKVNGSEDWYGILQVEPTADESLIKKQYRKLALLLHPDKNKFAGAEAAFKLIGEAHRTLSDRAKRSVYDLKRSATIKTVGPKPQPHHPSRAYNSRKQPAAAPFANNPGWSTQHQQAQATHASQTFWTICPSCGIRYQYYRTIINKALRCQNCLKPFIAYDIDAQGVPPGVNTGYPSNQSGGPQHKDPQGQGANNPSQQSNAGSASSNMDTQKNESGNPTVGEPVTRIFGQGYKTNMEDYSEGENGASRENEVKFEKVKLEKVNKGEPVVQPPGHASQKRRRKVVVESSDTDSTDNETIFQGSEHAAAWNAEAIGGRYPRRSTRQKQNVIYNEDNSDADDFENPSSSKRSRRDGSLYTDDWSDKTSSKDDVSKVDVPTDADTVSKNKPEGSKRSISSDKADPNGNKPGKNCMKESGDFKKQNMIGEDSKDEVGPKSDSTANKLNVEDVAYPDPEFHDFDKDKDPGCFAVDQIWAIYDNLDGMPRFYARIRSVSSGFKVRFTWLEHDPVDQAEMDWYKEELPVGCGNFRPGKMDTSGDVRMFSHLMSWSKGQKRSSYGIYPRKGEIWALFKGWDNRWSLDPDLHREYKYELVKVLSDFSVDTGANVVPLIKVKGFVSLFCEGGNQKVGALHIPQHELLRFSHLVPSYRLTGKEREGVPEGFYELDSVALPNDLEVMFPSLTLDEVRVNVEDAGHGNGVPSFIFENRERKCADDFEDHRTFRNNIETGEKIQVEKPLEHIDLSSEGSNRFYEKKKGQATAGKFSPTDGKKNVGERMHYEHLVTDREMDGVAPGTSGNNVTENGNGSMPEYRYPDSEFFNFDEIRAKEKFAAGQIWALYCEDDGFPKYYAFVRKVNRGNDFKVHITWLEACPQLQEERKWAERDLPFGCGRFRLCSGRDGKGEYDKVETFSHMVVFEGLEKKQLYDIYPQVAEVWAVYRNWSDEWQPSDLENCAENAEFEVVEILSRSDSSIEVMVLEKVAGFKAVFRRRNSGGAFAMEIFPNQYLKFSHRIPSFRLTEQRGGKLRGYWELDPASLPEILLCTNSV